MNGTSLWNFDEERRRQERERREAEAKKAFVKLLESSDLLVGDVLDVLLEDMAPSLLVRELGSAIERKEAE